MALTNNILLGFQDFVQSGQVYDQSVATVEVTGYPLSNVLLPDLWRPVVFQQTVSNLKFTVDLQASKPIGLVALLKHTLDSTAKWRVYLNQDYDSDPLGQEYDSGWLTAVPPYPGYGSLNWGQFLWGGVAPEAQSKLYNRHSYHPLPDTVIARYVTIELSSPANSDLVRLFRLWASDVYQPSVNVDYGASVEIIDDTKVVQSASGVRQYGNRVQRRRINAGFDMLPRSEMLYYIISGIYMGSGISQNIIALLEPSDPSNYLSEAVYGNLVDIDKTSYSSWLQWDTSFSIEEAV